MNRVDRLLSSLDRALEQSCSASSTRGLASTSTSRKRRLIASICSTEVAASDGRPHSWPQFLARLKTFTPSRWFAKPDSASAIVCARHGWCCTAANSLVCTSCRATLVHDERADPSAEALLLALSSAHSEDCCWRALSCPADFARLPFESSAEVAHKLAQRLNSFRAVESPLSVALPAEITTVFPKLAELLASSDDQQTARLLNALSPPALEEASAFARLSGPRSEGSASGLSGALLLSLCGWSLVSDSLCCECCGRTIRLTTPLTVSKPLAEHRPFCPWLATDAQDGRRSGWHTGCSVLAGAAGLARGGDGEDAAAAYRKALHTLELASSFQASAL